MADDSGRITLGLTSGSNSDTTAVLTIGTGWDASSWASDATEPEEVLFYDICSIADHLNATKIVVTYNTSGVIEPSVNACSGEVQYSSGTTTVGDLSDGAEIITFFAPALICF